MMMPRQPRYDSLDLWRGIACLFVVVFHSTNGYILAGSTPQESLSGLLADRLLTFISHLWIGVPMFFVVSL